METIRIAVLGIGYMGLITSSSMSKLGFRVICTDMIPGEVKNLNKGIPPF